jgi:hypothetical protein
LSAETGSLFTIAETNRSPNYRRIHTVAYLGHGLADANAELIANLPELLALVEEEGRLDLADLRRHGGMLRSIGVGFSFSVVVKMPRWPRRRFAARTQM